MSLIGLFKQESSSWGSEEEIERRNRIKVAVYAYAYEVIDDPLVADNVFDDLCNSINPTVSTNHPRLDKFFETHFDRSTGMWIYKHPELNKIKQTYLKHYAINR